MFDFPKPYLDVYKSGGLDWEMNLPPRPLHSLVFESTKKFPNKTAMIFYKKEITYSQLATAVTRTAAALYEQGLRKGDRISLMLPNCPDFIYIYYAAMSLGAVVVNTNPMYVEREIEHQVNDSGSAMIATLTVLYPRVKAIRGNTPLKKVFLTDFAGKPETMPDDTIWLPDFYAVDRTPAPEAEIDPLKDLAVLQYTGGTTGVSKGAMLSHNNLYINAMMVNKFFRSDTKKDRIMTVLPLFHVYGMTCCMNLAMAAGTTMILAPRFVPEEIAQLIRDYKPTFFPGVPTMFVAMLNSPAFKDFKDYDKVSEYNAGGGPLPLEIGHTYDRLLAGTDSKMTEGYGLSEASPVTHSNPAAFGKNKRGCIGVPYPETHAAVVDLETGTRSLPIGEIGELVVKGPQVMLGYWNRPEQTAQTLRDGWLYTGDMAKMDEEGFFYIVDRKKDMIIASGYNIYPREVEEVLFENSKVQEVAAVGVPDAYRGETVKAYVVLKEGQTATEEELINFCKERLAPYKVPKMIQIRDALPKSAVGKLLRRKLIEEEREKLKNK